MPSNISLYVASACSTATDRSGWAAILLHPASGSRLELHGGAGHTDRHRMHVMALLCALRELTRPCHITICSDYHHICDAFAKGWLENWQKNGWVRSDRTEVRSADLWKEIAELAAQHTIETRYLGRSVKDDEMRLCQELALEEAETEEEVGRDTEDTEKRTEGKRTAETERLPDQKSTGTDGATLRRAAAAATAYTLFTDGSCLGNPGPGGWAAVLQDGHGTVLKERAGGFRYTTNNRMEILSVIRGLETVPPESTVDLYSDSQYVCNALSRGWLKSWIRKNWMRTPKERVKNVDLWKVLAERIKDYTLRVHWIRGHNGNAGNERCDVLARAMAQRPDLPSDDGLDGSDL